MHLEVIRRFSITEDVYRQLRDAIFGGVLTPGERLDVGRLAESFGVSNQPVKEALHRLTLEGLTVIKPQNGAFGPCGLRTGGILHRRMAFPKSRCSIRDNGTR